MVLKVFLNNNGDDDDFELYRAVFSNYLNGSHTVDNTFMNYAK
jgi:hypothetical protein